VTFLQNHDQIGNRAFGERLATLADAPALEAAIALQLLCPQIPLIFMGEEDASQSPFLFFAQHDEALAAAVREGRKREFEGIADAGDGLADPNDRATFEQSIPRADPALASRRFALYRKLLALRREHISPALEGARALGARVVGSAAVLAEWSLGDGKILTIAANLGEQPASCGPPGSMPQGRLLFESVAGAHTGFRNGSLPGRTTVAILLTET
jgi:1,4-alpha-glucan branching enzyme